jgi:hypothetical protein
MRSCASYQGHKRLCNFHPFFGYSTLFFHNVPKHWHGIFGCIVNAAGCYIKRKNACLLFSLKICSIYISVLYINVFLNQTRVCIFTICMLKTLGHMIQYYIINWSIKEDMRGNRILYLSGGYTYEKMDKNEIRSPGVKFLHFRPT